MGTRPSPATTCDGEGKLPGAGGSGWNEAFFWSGFVFHEGWKPPQVPPLAQPLSSQPVPVLSLSLSSLPPSPHMGVAAPALPKPFCFLEPSVGFCSGRFSIHQQPAPLFALGDRFSATEQFLDRGPGFPDAQLVASCAVGSLQPADRLQGTRWWHPAPARPVPSTPVPLQHGQRCPQDSRSHRTLRCLQPRGTALALGCCLIPQHGHGDSATGPQPQLGRRDLSSCFFQEKKINKSAQAGASPSPWHGRGDTHAPGSTGSTSRAPGVGDRGDGAWF